MNVEIFGKLKIPCVSTNERYWNHQNNPGYLPINERRLCYLPFRTMVLLMEQNPAPVDMVKIPLFTGFHTSQVDGNRISEPSTVLKRYVVYGLDSWEIPGVTLLGTNISHKLSPLKMIFLFPWWDM